MTTNETTARDRVAVAPSQLREIASNIELAGLVHSPATLRQIADDIPEVLRALAGAPTAREIPADELAEAERRWRTAAASVPTAVWDRILLAEYDERGRLVRWWRERFYQLGRERDAARAEVQRLQFVVERQRGELAKLRARDEKATTVVQAWTALAPKYPGFEGDGDLQVALDELARAHEEAQ